MIAVIADDITGAAEMAGIAHRLGLRVKLTMQPEATPDCDVLVIATDTRSMSESEAAIVSRELASNVMAIPGVDAIFKKTDSALRGHVVAELEAMLSVTDYDRALFIPANPSRGRIIRDGVYYIGETPLHETDFSFDPEFPAFSSALSERLPDCEAKGVRYADAVCAEDIMTAVKNVERHTLLAGAADLFTELLRQRFPCSEIPAEKCVLDLSDCLIIRGSTQSKAIDCGVETAYMPTEVYDETVSPESWIQQLADSYSKSHALIIAVRDRHRTGKAIATYLRGTMADATAALASVHNPTELIIEGGATAFAILHRLGWNSFTITQEISPGVIRMRATNGTHITMKPGSYPWGQLF